MTRTRSVIGTSLSLLLAATGFCAFTGVANASQSDSFMLQEAGPGHAAGTPSGSTNFQMQGDVTWRQEAPLRGQTFQITNAPPPQVSSSSSSVATSSAQSSTPTQGGGGGRGNGTTTTNPPASRASSSSSARSSVAPVPSSAGPASSSIASPEPSVSSASSTPESERSSSSVAAVTSSSASSVSSAASSSSSDEYVRPAAPGEYEAPETETTVCNDTVLCADPFYHPIVLIPVPANESDEVGLGDMVATDPAAVSLILLGIILSVVVGYFNTHVPGANRFVRNAWYLLVALSAIFTLAYFTVQAASAAVSSPQRHVYNGHLLNAAGAPITTAHYIRFSEWYSRDMDATDVSAGVINTGAATYAGYQEVHVVTPDSQGYFSVELGSGASLPNLADIAASDLDNLFLQVEVKAAGNPDSSYELLDVNPSDDAIDRSPILSVPFAQNADLLDQREIGTGSGSIPLLMSGGVLSVDAVPGGTNSDTFTVDTNNTAASEVVLQFGGALAETLKFDVLDDTFVFSADLKVEGDLVVTGLINGIDISAIAGSDDGKLRVSSGAGLTVNVTGGAYRINGDVTDYTGASGVAVAANATNYVFIGSGGLTVRTSGYPTDESFIRLGEVITDGAGVTQVNDERVVLSDDREHATEVNMHAEFPNASYQADATENTGQLSVSLDNITLRNFYLWTSTRTTLQDYDVVVRVSLPADFVRWDASPLSVSYRTTSADAANSKVDVSVFDTNGTPVSLGGSATGLASTSWGTSALTFSGAPTWTAGQEFLVKFKLYAKDDFQAHVGSMKLKYVRLTP